MSRNLTSNPRIMGPSERRDAVRKHMRMIRNYAADLVSTDGAVTCSKAVVTALKGIEAVSYDTHGDVRLDMSSGRQYLVTQFTRHVINKDPECVIPAAVSAREFAKELARCIAAHDNTPCLDQKSGGDA